MEYTSLLAHAVSTHYKQYKVGLILKFANLSD